MNCKQELRKIVSELLKNQQIVGNFEASCKEICELKEYANAQIIAGYIPFQNEASPTPFLCHAFNGSKIIALPKINADNMDFYACNESTQFEKNQYGIFEPKNARLLDLVVAENASKNWLIVVPGIAFTKDGRRLGRGKGYYDRFFSNVRNICTLVGFCHSIQLVDDIPTETHDVVMDYVVTEQGIIKCKK